MIRIEIEDPSLILLVGPSGAGKSTFAATHFQPTEIISSDNCRAMICDDQSDQSVTHQAFGLLHHITRLRMAGRRLSVIDATNLHTRARKPLLRIAGCFSLPVYALVFNVSLEKCLANNINRGHRFVDEQAITHHSRELLLAIEQMKTERFKAVFVLDENNVESAKIIRTFQGSRI